MNEMFPDMIWCWSEVIVFMQWDGDKWNISTLDRRPEAAACWQVSPSRGFRAPSVYEHHRYRHAAAASEYFLVEF